MIDQKNKRRNDTILVKGGLGLENVVIVRTGPACLSAAIDAAGTGYMAALDAQTYLESMKRNNSA
jgi:hypothetical protein